MRLLICSVALVALFAGSRPAIADERGDEYARLVGNWRATAGAWAGKPLTGEQARGCTLIFHPARAARDLSGGPRGMDLRVPDKIVSFKVVGKGDAVETLYRTDWIGYNPGLNTTTTPRTITTFKQDGLKGVGFEGIYRIEDNELTVCFNFDRGGKRPRAFESPADSMVLLLTLKPAKAK